MSTTSLVAALERTCALLERSEESVYSPLTPAEVVRNLRATIDALVRGQAVDDLTVRVEFAPTSTIQEIAMANGWHDEYLELARAVDSHVDMRSQESRRTR
jgi:hypothetical protein